MSFARWRALLIVSLMAMPLTGVLACASGWCGAGVGVVRCFLIPSYLSVGLNLISIVGVIMTKPKTSLPNSEAPLRRTMRRPILIASIVLAIELFLFAVLYTVLVTG